MSVPESIQEYLRMFGSELGDRILQTYPALHNAQIPYRRGLRDCFENHSPPRLSPQWRLRRSGIRNAVLQ